MIEGIIKLIKRDGYSITESGVEQLKAKDTVFDNDSSYIPYHSIMKAEIRHTFGPSTAVDANCAEDSGCDGVYFFLSEAAEIPQITQVQPGDTIVLYPGDQYELYAFDTPDALTDPDVDPLYIEVSASDPEKVNVETFDAGGYVENNITLTAFYDDCGTLTVTVPGFGCKAVFPVQAYDEPY